MSGIRAYEVKIDDEVGVFIFFSIRGFKSGEKKNRYFLNVSCENKNKKKRNTS